MYLTFYRNNRGYQISFEDLLKDPFMELPDHKLNIRHTVEASEEYCARLYEKNKPSFVPMNVLPFDKVNECYTHYEIPKRSNPKKKRKIDAPNEVLKNIQTQYKMYIENILHVLNHPAAFAYTKRECNVTAMQQHQSNKSNWYLQIDLKDFFPSLSREFLNKQLDKVYPFKFIPPETKEAIVEYSLLNGALPQGSVLSPTLSNIVMVPIDFKLTERLKNYNKKHFVYTRYADDITISCKYKFDYKEILKIIQEVFESEEAPFTINPDKTRFGSRAGKNYHVGLIVNKDNEISVGHEKNEQFRAMLFNFGQDYTHGRNWSPTEKQKLLGLISYYNMIEPKFVGKQLNKYNERFNIDIVNLLKR